MKFSRDIVIVDVETTGLDARHHEIIQLGAVRLDRYNLKEIDAYAVYVKPKHWQRQQKEAKAVHKIDFKTLKSAPELKKVLKEFNNTFSPKEVVLGNYGGTFDFDFLREGFAKSKLVYPYDYHNFNVWPFAYAYLASVNYKFKFKKGNYHHFTGFRMPDVAKALGLKIAQTHDALEDCRLEAEILRRVLRSFSPSPISERAGVR